MRKRPFWADYFPGVYRLRRRIFRAIGQRLLRYGLDKAHAFLAEVPKEYRHEFVMTLIDSYGAPPDESLSQTLEKILEDKATAKDAALLVLLREIESKRVSRSN